MYSGGDLAPSSHPNILIEISLTGKAGWEKDLSIAPMHSTNSHFNQLKHRVNIMLGKFTLLVR